MYKNISEIRLEDDGSVFVKSFNKLNDAYMDYLDENLSEEEKNVKLEKYLALKQCIELGIYN
jgi:hypothetical protein